MSVSSRRDSPSPTLPTCSHTGALSAVFYAPQDVTAPVRLLLLLLAHDAWTASPCSEQAYPAGLCCWRQAGDILSPSAVQSRHAVDCSIIFYAVGVLEQICACASGAPLREHTMWAHGSCMQDHASSSQINNLEFWMMSPARSPRVLADAPP